MRINVLYKGNLVGKVAEKDNKYYFKYEDAFIQSGIELSPLMMPLAKSLGKIYDFNHLYFNTFHGLPGLLADAIPDKFGNEILNTWLLKEGKTIEHLSSLERLAYIGKRGMGALEFEPELNTEHKWTQNAISLNELSDLSKLIVKNKSDKALKINNQNLLTLFDVGTSAGGARAKAVVLINPRTMEILPEQNKYVKGFAPSIIKFDTVSEKSNQSTNICLFEMAYYDMARKADIDMMPSKLIEENNRFHFATKRFDRTPKYEKIHTQTLCGIGHYNFRDFEQNSYEKLFYVARTINVSYQEKVQLFKRMLFNVVCRNQDDHTKNFAFLYYNNKWRIAPAYDLVYNYDAKGLFTQLHKMSINGKRDNFVWKDFEGIANDNAIKKPKEILEEVIEAAGLFPHIASKYGINEEISHKMHHTFRMKWN
ncbi:MAG: type II toxin-antitoxin system HipA family toxin [Chitinophagales bacterium]